MRPGVSKNDQIAYTISNVMFRSMELPNHARRVHSLRYIEKAMMVKSKGI